ncbi:MAG TPA: hypothetical protein VME18_10535 [Acidobacteriaceae bacterium]|nr:hypothetical protein [Acidobacteriaceae bacterium]
MLRFGRNSRFLWIVLLTGVFAAIPAHAQQAPAPMPPQQQLPTPLGPQPNTSQQRMLRQMARERNLDRQKQIVADADKLLALARQLKSEVDKSNKDQLSLSVVDTAGQIEKLAKTVKERMRDGT